MRELLRRLQEELEIMESAGEDMEAIECGIMISGNEALLILTKLKHNTHQFIISLN